MNLDPVPLPPADSELAMLVEAMCEGTITPAERDRLEFLLENDDKAKLYYVACLDLHAQMRWLMRGGQSSGGVAGRDVVGHDVGSEAFPALDAEEQEGGVFEDFDSAPSLPPVIIDTSLPPQSFGLSPWAGYLSQIGPFSYLVSAVIMCVAVLAAWQYKLGDDPRAIVRNLGVSGSQGTNAALVGCVSAMDESLWASHMASDEKRYDPTRSLDARVSAGREFNVEKGLLEITYQSGARVLLQGPASFKVGVNGGFLAVGKLTGRLDSHAKASRSQSSHELFCIRTPSAVVTDLGTEFGVEVTRDGQTVSHVYQGAVAISPAGTSDDRPSLILKKGDAVRAMASNGGGARIERIESAAERFVRELSAKRVPIAVFGTGLGVEDGHGDPRWELTRISGDPDFVPRPATVITSIRRTWTPNVSGREKWLSPSCAWYQSVPVGTKYTFRTTFNLNGGKPETARLRGRMFGVAGVVALRLNGQDVAEFDPDSRPKHAWESGRIWQKLLIEQGFVEGDNVLEIDVESGDPPSPPDPMSALGLRVEIEGSIQQEP
jgi:hypothetical protein